MDSSSIESQTPRLSVIKPSAKKAITDNEAFEIFKTLSQSQFTANDLCRVNVSDGVFYIDNVLSFEECSSICNIIDNSENLGFWNPLGRVDEVLRFRDVDTLELQSPQISDIIWSRISRKIGDIKDVVVNDSDDDQELGCTGSWQIYGMNNNILLGKYPSGGSFAPHTDGNVVYSFNKRSFYSAILYLNDIEVGGETSFYESGATESLILTEVRGRDIWMSPAKFHLLDVRPKAGRLLIFHQHYVHCGQPPNSPYLKYILRSDLMFSRQPPICNEPTDIQAFQYYQDAQVLAEAGDVEHSIALFQKAFKLSPNLKFYLKQG